MKSIVLALMVLNEYKKESTPLLSPDHIIKFGIMASQKNAEFAQLHQMMRQGILSKPLEQNMNEISKEDTEKAFNERNTLI